MGLMENKNITIDDLAAMVQKGFAETAKKQDVDKRFDEVDKYFGRVENRLDRIEKLLIVDNRERIEKLEIDVMDLKNLLAVK